MAHRDTRFWLPGALLIAASAAVGCSSAHRPDYLACSPGDTPLGCAVPATGSECCWAPAASCIAGRWQCSAPAVLASTCVSVSLCEGYDASAPPPRDAGSPLDAGGPPAWQACTSPSECVVSPASCCGSCGAARPGDMIGVHRDHQSDYSTIACAGGGACPGCFAQQDPALVATCSSGICEAVDLGATRATECAIDDDCNLAVPQCCACGTMDPWQVISLASAHASDLYTLICDPGLDCGACPGPPEFPAGLTAGCDAGRCIVRGR